ncbi:MAG: hypothetical protein DWQ31_08680 [Planctomycetota bacterium]|nr:MAG: hypothetical protein DWQ31_08680 [Planctomycetota bacterium]REJ86933.1 MAG: hypothetical protein DWQ35_22490 [Planctomycetota bacterium]REK24940.1 MAG: hypothetical protein DWQ42_12680 [Planctomycetota bacterium]REK48529.1 MAG: hypothetical protein DWQ46_02210 [Planctomycetota bacterium]
MDEDRDIEAEAFRVNPGYALGRIAKALMTSAEHPDHETRERARQKVSKWLQVFEGVVNGDIAAGSRTPVADVPEWATLEVVTGGFATGELLAGGDILDHERSLLAELSISARGSERQTLNAYFVTEDGMSRLRDQLASGRYDIQVPEEGALLVAAWLVNNGHAEIARGLLEQIGAFFGRLRFYPIPAAEPRRFSSRVFLQNVSTTIDDLNSISPNRQILAQKEAIEVWAPLYDKTVNLFLETVEGEPPVIVSNGDAESEVKGGRPCSHYPNEWAVRAQSTLDEYATKRKVHTLCGKPDRKKENFRQLRLYLARCIDDARSLSDVDVNRIRLLLARSVYRRGVPESDRCKGIRARQSEQIRGATHYEVSRVIVSRLEQHPLDVGLDELDSIVRPITIEESERFGVETTATIPPSIQHKAQRCLIETVDELIERGVITSGDTLARVLPQITSELRAAGITDPILRQLYASIYRAFRRRRSLLLMNLESQVKIEELPWVAAIDGFRREDLSAQALARETLREIVTLTLTSFPHAIIPNKLLQELRALAKDSELDLPLVDEIAADIFQGQFSAKYVRAAKRAASLLEGGLYEAYYGIEYATIHKIAEPPERQSSWFRRPISNRFAELCSSRAGVRYGGWDVVTHGMIIEQQQILTTQNLAVLFAALDLRRDLDSHLPLLAQHCFRWICDRQQANSPTWHGLLIMLKNTAYAWRQMIFYLALLPDDQIQEFLVWADEELRLQQPDFQSRFRPALDGLRLAAEGKSIDDQECGCRFLGWAKGRQWLLGPDLGSQHFNGDI